MRALELPRFLAWYARCTYPVCMRSFLIAVPMLLALACGGSVNVLERSASAGAITVTGSEETVRSRADRYMRDHCANGYTLVDECPTNDGWRMSYRCNEARGLIVETEARIESVVVRF